MAAKAEALFERNIVMKVSLVLLTLNEIDGMRAIMPRIKKEWYDQLVIVDGGSTDGTIEYAREHGYYLIVQKEKGAGAAFLEAMEKVDGDLFIVLSPDGNSIPEKIPELIKEMQNGYDLVIVSRYLNGAKSYDDDFVTSFGNWMFTKIINLLFRTRLTDSLVMYRAYRRKGFQALKITSKTSSWGTQSLLRIIKSKLKICEIPGDEPSRIGGIRKMHPLKNGIRELSMILREVCIRRF